jgi:hypothetical protein
VNELYYFVYNNRYIYNNGFQGYLKRGENGPFIIQIKPLLLGKAGPSHLPLLAAAVAKSLRRWNRQS